MYVECGTAPRLYTPIHPPTHPRRQGRAHLTCMLRCTGVADARVLQEGDGAGGAGRGGQGSTNASYLGSNASAAAASPRFGGTSGAAGSRVHSAASSPHASKTSPAGVSQSGWRPEELRRVHGAWDDLRHVQGNLVFAAGSEDAGAGRDDQQPAPWRVASASSVQYPSNPREIN